MSTAAKPRKEGNTLPRQHFPYSWADCQPPAGTAQYTHKPLYPAVGWLLYTSLKLAGPTALSAACDCLRSSPPYIYSIYWTCGVSCLPYVSIWHGCSGLAGGDLHGPGTITNRLTHSQTQLRPHVWLWDDKASVLTPRPRSLIATIPSPLSSSSASHTAPPSPPPAAAG